MVVRKYILQKFCARIRIVLVWSVLGPEEFSVNPGMTLLMVLIKRTIISPQRTKSKDILVNTFNPQRFHACLFTALTAKFLVFSRLLRSKPSSRQEHQLLYIVSHVWDSWQLHRTTCVVTAIRHSSLIVAGIGKAIRNKLLTFSTYSFA